MTEYVWSELRDPFTAHVGESPSAAIEQRIIDVFSKHPVVVTQGIEHVRERYDRGLVRSPWPVLAKHVEEERDAAERATSVRATDTSDRRKLVERADCWIRSTGHYFDSEGELLDELFGDVGMLRQYAKDDELRERLLMLWRQRRVEVEIAEREYAQRVEREREERRRQPLPPALLAYQRRDSDGGNPFL